MSRTITPREELSLAELEQLRQSVSQVISNKELNFKWARQLARQIASDALAGAFTYPWKKDPPFPQRTPATRLGHLKAFLSEEDAEAANANAKEVEEMGDRQRRTPSVQPQPSPEERQIASGRFAEICVAVEKAQNVEDVKIDPVDPVTWEHFAVADNCYRVACLGLQTCEIFSRAEKEVLAEIDRRKREADGDRQEKTINHPATDPAHINAHTQKDSQKKSRGRRPKPVPATTQVQLKRLDKAVNNGSTVKGWCLEQVDDDPHKAHALRVKLDRAKKRLEESGT